MNLRKSEDDEKMIKYDDKTSTIKKIINRI